MIQDNDQLVDCTLRRDSESQPITEDEIDLKCDLMERETSLCLYSNK